MTVNPPSLPTGVALAALGGALGALARWSITVGFGSAIWTTMAINVAGSLALTALPHAPVVRRHHWLPVFLGAGMLGGFTTMSGAALLHPGQRPVSFLVFVATAAITLPLVRAVGRLVPVAEATEFDDEGGAE